MECFSQLSEYFSLSDWWLLYLCPPILGTPLHLHPPHPNHVPEPKTGDWVFRGELVKTRNSAQWRKWVDQIESRVWRGCWRESWRPGARRSRWLETQRPKQQKQDCQLEIKPGVQMAQETGLKGERAESQSADNNSCVFPLPINYLILFCFFKIVVGAFWKILCNVEFA